jgi:hypothetical protein
MLTSGTRILFVVATILAALQAQTPTPARTPQPQAPIATISAGPSARVIPPPPNYHYPNGQTYVYAVEWHFFNAGTAKVSIDSVGGQEHVTAVADSAGVVNSLFKVRDRFEAFFDPRTFCSMRIAKHTEEGSHAKQTEATFDYQRHKSWLDEKNLKTGETRHLDNDLPVCVTDVISGFYYVSSLPLQVGNTHAFLVSDGGKDTVVIAQVEAREKIKVPAGTFDTVRLRAEAASGPLKAKGTVWAWYTDDANHTPVQMRSKLGWGTLIFQLVRIDKQ